MDNRRQTGEAMAPPSNNDIIQDLTYAAILKDYGIGEDKPFQNQQAMMEVNFIVLVNKNVRILPSPQRCILVIRCSLMANCPIINT
jgi:hypothetical protein